MRSRRLVLPTRNCIITMKRLLIYNFLRLLHFSSFCIFMFRRRELVHIRLEHISSKQTNSFSTLPVMFLIPLSSHPFSLPTCNKLCVSQYFHLNADLWGLVPCSYGTSSTHLLLQKLLRKITTDILCFRKPF